MHSNNTLLHTAIIKPNQAQLKKSPRMVQVVKKTKQLSVDSVTEGDGYLLGKLLYISFCT